MLWHDYGMGQVPSLRSFRKSLSKMGADLFEDYTYIKRADTLAQSDYKKEEKLAALEALKQHYKTVMEQQQCLSLKDLKLTGKDLIDMGMKPGKDMGAMLQRLLERVLEEPELNEREKLMELVRKMM